MAHPLQVIFFCRFSYPGTKNPFQSGPDTVEDRVANLYADTRMRERLFFFKHITLPALRVQTDPDFDFVILIGTAMPARWRNELEELMAGISQARIVARDPGPDRKTYSEVLHAHRHPGARHVAEVRMDDDDAVAVDYVTKLRNLYPSAVRSRMGLKRVAVDHNCGLLLNATAPTVTYRPLRAPFWGVALAVIVDPDDSASALDFPHHKIWTRMPVHSRPHPLMFIRGYHEANDSAIGPSAGIAFEMDDHDIGEALDERFAIDRDTFQRDWLKHRSKA
ncbi:glycosyltransferase [Aestuariibius sp. 2305UL40-4]|uniref:glycosyltransferase n=1 Tax=Aestuariibius violaceus TaxID=3234132 RepID=UPI00345EF1B0